MTGKKREERGSDARAVELRIDGEAVYINGYVMDVFQEVTLGLVRALGGENADGRIEVTIGPAKS